MLPSPLRLGKHWSCPFLDKVSIISKGNKFTPLYLSLWFPSQCTTWASASKNLNQQLFFQFHLVSAASCLHKPNLSTQRQLIGFYEQEQNSDERQSLMAFRSVIHKSVDRSLSHSILLSNVPQLHVNSVLCPRRGEHGEFHLGNRHSKAGSEVIGFSCLVFLLMMLNFILPLKFNGQQNNIF